MIAGKPGLLDEVRNRFLHVDACFVQRAGNLNQLLAGGGANDGNDAAV